jgi:intracellular septation protein A
VDVVGIVASCTLLVLFCACVVVALVRKVPAMAVLALVGAFMFGVLALALKDPKMLEEARKFVETLFDKGPGS